MDAASPCRLGIFLLIFGFLAQVGRAATWFPLGPYGGDARSFAVDPHDSKHLYLGTETGWIYQSHDDGKTWSRISQIEGRSDLVIDHIVMDPTAPSRLVVGAWTLNRPSGGIFVSEDEGRHWYRQAEMGGQSVRSLARSVSDPKILVAGTLQGVFRSEDGGTHWKQISPEGSTEIHEVQSVAIDPKDPKVIYIGTWHLPWKTVDGGEHWESIKSGIIDDSDVFSIVIDPAQPKTIYASACSGIYKSEDGGDHFKGGVSVNRGQGIPSSARRTRKLALDPMHLDTVYAGTTEGLYKTTDGGEKWAKMTPDDVIINDVYVDPNDPQHVLLATERGGVLRSEDGGTEFEASSIGFSSRQVSAYAADPNDPALVFVGVVNDKQTGGVFASKDGGVKWQQMSLGLDGRDVFSLASTPDGTLLAGTAHGIFRLEDGAWMSAAEASHERKGERGTKRETHRIVEKKVAERASKVDPKADAKAAAGAGALADAAIYSLVNEGPYIYAGSSAGLWRSLDNGETWSQMHPKRMDEVRFVAAHGSTLMVAGPTGADLSNNGGTTWTNVVPPAQLTQIGAVAVDGENNLWIGGPEGVFYSRDHGATWQTLRNLFVRQVDGIFYDRHARRVLVTASSGTVAFAAELPDYKITYWDTGWKLRFLRPLGDHLIGATLYDGMVLQPKMVVSAITTDESASTH
ncbi:MAG TPA: YCF48-related protein [Acidobacteriaceae bacterium]|jgi:photosystem II stability/assembly factor-like uncharacterized protein|nr:YCF48-related protein [Acidobacteriaceae bacterium]